MLKVVDYKDSAALIKAMRGRASTVNAEVTETVSAIIARVAAEGDTAVRTYTERFDGVKLEALEVDREAILGALQNSDPTFVSALTRAKSNIEAFHARQKTQSFIDTGADGVILGQRVRGLERVGLYVPGGTAAYLSSVLMNAVPAQIAGVKEIIMVTPPGRDGQPNPDILAAAAICGISRVFMVGGAQAVAALAYGTESIPKVYKIVGPGNIYVATAKKLLFGVVDIDMIAGPSEILIMADDTANPEYVAADMLSQAEHDVLASAILLTTSRRVAEETQAALRRQTDVLPRKAFIEQSLEGYGAIILCETNDQLVEAANIMAPEHLEVLMEDPFEYIGRIDNAGSIFLGSYSPEPVGDYYAGPNHVLPTSGTARFFSPLSVDSFVKRSSFIYYTQEALAKAGADIITIATKEGLDAHANAVKVRLD